MGDLNKWDVAFIAVVSAIILQMLKTAYPPLFWIIFSILVWVVIYRKVK
jgi:hypothetical protein|tara:strand:- start:329 stop:475 length:147 start_codon:yes stop_codon:yes gene_type:complete